jgi:cell division septation protein DedD
VANDNGSGGIGLLGVVIGALIVVALGYFFLPNRATGPATSTVRIEAPKVPGSK